MAEVALRPIDDSDLDALFEQMRDPESVRMAAFTAENPDDRTAFDVHMAKVRTLPGATTRAVTVDGRLAGSIASFVVDGDTEVTYWIDRSLWGQGIAGRALALLLESVRVRPLFARAASDNVRSLKMLQRAGFAIIGTAISFANARNKEIEETILRLHEPAKSAPPRCVERRQADLLISARPDVFEDQAVDDPACCGAERHELRRGGRRIGHGKAVISSRAGRHDGGVADDGGADWAGYYAWSAGREPRPVLLAACQELGAGQDRLAIDLGCGEGTDALELLARGWLVLAVDAEPAGLALLRARIPPAAAGRIRVLHASFAEAELPSAHLIHAGFSLPFCLPQEFPALWARIRRALAPGGVFAGQLFGTRDTWADDPGMTFHARHQAETLLDGLDILRLEETERDGHAFSGPKHWHTFDILARKPFSQRAPSAPASC